MKRLYLGHVHLKLEVPRLTCLSLESNRASTVGGEDSSKEPFNQRINSYSENLHMTS
jgi:hypothetical protein